MSRPPATILAATGAACLALGLAFLLVFCLSPSYVDASGVLHEPFALLPLGWLAVALGLVLGVAGLMTGAATRLRERSE